MIARIWNARTDGPEVAERYRQVFTTEVLDHLRGVTGFRGAYLLARESGAAVEIRTLTLLDSDPVIRHVDVLAALSGEAQQ